MTNETKEKLKDFICKLIDSANNNDEINLTQECEIWESPNYATGYMETFSGDTACVLKIYKHKRNELPLKNNLRLSNPISI
jgi:hypothetical protein